MCVLWVIWSVELAASIGVCECETATVWLLCQWSLLLCDGWLLLLCSDADLKLLLTCLCLLMLATCWCLLLCKWLTYVLLLTVLQKRWRDSFTTCILFWVILFLIGNEVIFPSIEYTLVFHFCWYALVIVTHIFSVMDLCSIVSVPQWDGYVVSSTMNLII